MGNAGRVLMIPKGDYNAATTYERLDFVYYQGRSYVCKQTSTGNAPTNTTYWQALTGDASAEIQALANEVRGNWATGGINVFDKSIMSDAVGEATYKNIVLKPNTTYTASTTLPKNNNNSANFFAYNSSGSPATSTNGLWDGQTRNITTNNDGIITIMYRTTDFTDTSAAWFLNHEFQIEVGSTATPYQPYAKTNVELTADKAEKSDLASISITGTTNNTGATITSGTYFYLNGALVRAKTSIANGATLTKNTNYEEVTTGGLNELSARTTFSLTSDDSIYIHPNNPWNFEKVGKVACVRIRPLKNNVPQGQSIKLGTVPVEYRPYIEPSFRVIIPNNYVMSISISSSGDVLVYNYNIPMGDGTSVINTNESLTYIAD